jgi:L-ascorbate metabolism protein UlaG (beta-lactamase superfamily)
MIKAQKEGKITDNDGKVKISFYGMISYMLESPGGVKILFDPFRNAPDLDLGGIWFLSQFPEIEADIVISSHAHGDHDGMARVKAPLFLDRFVGTLEIGDVKITGFPDKHVSNPMNEIYDGRILEQVFGKHNYPPYENMEWDNSIILVETGEWRVVFWGDNRQNPPQEVFDQLHDIDIYLSAISDDGHITSPQWGDIIGKKMNAKVVFPGHYNVEGINHPWASGISPATNYTRMHDHTYIKDKVVTLSKDDIKDYEFHVMYFGENVNWNVLKWPHKPDYTKYPVIHIDEWPGDPREWEKYKPKNGDRY